MLATINEKPIPFLRVVLLAAVTASAGFSIDLCLPALPFISEALASDMGQVQQIISVFILGVGFGQLIHGPLADHFGRKPLLIAGLVVFTISSVLCSLAQSVEQLIIFRLLQSLGVAAGAVVMRAVVRDFYQGEQAAKVFSQIMLVVLIAPLVAPLLSAQLLLWFSWRLIFVILALFGLALLVGVTFRLPETLPASGRTKIVIRKLPKQYLAVLRDRNTLGYFLCGSFTFAGMFAFVAGSPFVYIQYYHVLVVFIGCLGLIAANCNAGMLDPFGKSAGTASAIMGAGRFMMGGVASMMVGFFYNGTPVPMATVICASSVLAFLSYRIFVDQEKTPQQHVKIF